MVTVTGNGITPELRKALQDVFPQVADKYREALPQAVVAALGIPMKHPTIDRRLPHAMLSSMTDAQLQFTINVEVLEHLRRFMRDEQDAMGVPLEKVA